ncbi:MAG: hypothetical protein COX77_04905 [Candidatus Komeilibacteria bacterium CG_4_10_14_0_2_um_filter_37_10]|uniref:UvrABC system protein C n=1 Tax=Candidatus Komeilibacteria bacterium CG_4_10_14_0_2_um_filter_37_10 TaxID=1974470 RepID=A0A2M7VD22_9BACT|nr:MAG: hypothetical protein COX77_04905 [Candidatus Komeilibacteria bacterium CG_4_10_14_0_2_um_filter_37_10]
MLRKLQDKLNNLPRKPGIYQFLGHDDQLLYIGKAINLKSRVSSYWQKNNQLTPAKQLMISLLKKIKYTVVNNETEAILLERTLIQKYQPPYNIDLKDDKYWQYIKIDLRDPWPRVETTRRFLPAVKIRYFGPYTSGKDVIQLIKLIKKIYPYRICDRDLTSLPNGSVCWQYHLGLCLGPCEKKCSSRDYQGMIRQIIRFLSGDTKETINYLEQKILTAADNQDFELAATYRDQLIAVKKIKTKQQVLWHQKVNEDYLGLQQNNQYYFINLFKVRQGKLIDQNNFTVKKNQHLNDEEILLQFIEHYYQQTTDQPKKIIVAPNFKNLTKPIFAATRGRQQRLLKLAEVNALEYARFNHQPSATDKTLGVGLEQLQKGLLLTKIPERIEVYDISNIQGVYAVGSMIVFINGQAAKNEYRKFTIKKSNEPNDPAMMLEVLQRRINHPEWPAPDLIILDGGKTQLGMIKKIANWPTWTTIALAKQNEDIHLPNGHIIKFKKKSSAYFLLQRMRDEAHRFAINYYRQRHQKGGLLSQLDKISGLGPKTKKTLQQNFVSLNEIKLATEQQLKKLIGPTKTKLLINALN